MICLLQMLSERRMKDVQANGTPFCNGTFMGYCLQRRPHRKPCNAFLRNAVDLVAASASDCRGDDGRDEHRQQLGCLGHASGSFAVGKGALIEHVAVSEK